MTYLKYIETTGGTTTGSIGVSLSTDMDIEIKYAYEPILSAGGNHGQILASGSQFRIGGDCDIYLFIGGSYTKITNREVFDGSITVYHNGTYVYNGTEYDALSGKTFGSGNLFIFTTGTTGSDTARSGTRLGEFVIYKSGVETNHFYPILDDSNIACFYDSITENYVYPNRGTFVAGPQIETESKLYIGGTAVSAIYCGESEPTVYIGSTKIFN